MAVSTDKKSKSRKKNKKSKIVLFDEEIVTIDKAEKILSEARPKENNTNSVTAEKKPKIKKKKPEPVVEEKNSEEIKTVETKSSKNKQNSAEQKKKKKRKAEQSSGQTNIKDTAEPDLKKKKQEEEQVNNEEPTELDPAKPEIKKKESIRERKRKKHLKLLEEKKLKTELALQQKSLNYLSKWKYSRDDWKFEKLKQIWLQQNMFDSSKVPDKFWQTLVEYFNNSKGQARSLIMKDALKVIENEESNDSNNIEDKDEEYQIKMQRARDIIQSLQE